MFLFLSALLTVKGRKKKPKKKKTQISASWWCQRNVRESQKAVGFVLWGTWMFSLGQYFSTLGSLTVIYGVNNWRRKMHNNVMICEFIFSIKMELSVIHMYDVKMKIQGRVCTCWLHLRRSRYRGGVYVFYVWRCNNESLKMN